MDTYYLDFKKFFLLSLSLGMVQGAWKLEKNFCYDYTLSMHQTILWMLQDKIKCDGLIAIYK